MSDGLTEVLAVLARLEKAQQATSAELLTVRTDLMARMDRLQDSFSQLRDEVLVNYGAIERAELEMRNGVGQTRLLADQMHLMFKRLHNIDGRVSALEDKRPS